VGWRKGFQEANRIMEGWMEFGEVNWYEGRLWKLNSRWVGVWSLGKSTIRLVGMMKRRSRLRYAIKSSGELKQQHCF
jgi:hypothetical protein